MFLCPPNSYVEILMPNVMVLGGGAFKKWLGHESGDLVKGISALMKKIPQSSLAPSTTWEHIKKQEEGSYQTQNLIISAPWYQIYSFQNCEK